MTILHILLFLILNFAIYTLVVKSNSFQLQIIITIILIAILKLLGNVENSTALNFIMLANFSVGIPFFSFCFTFIKNRKKQINSSVYFKIVKYFEERNYVLHITLLITFYQLFVLLTETVV